MDKAILVLNAGSSSIKFSVFGERSNDLTLLMSGQIEGLYTRPHFIAKDAEGGRMEEKTWTEGAILGHRGGLDTLIHFLRGHSAEITLSAVGHRVVHGGTAYAKPERVNADLVKSLETLIPLAPLHQPHNLAPIRLILEQNPQLPQVACFDTAFHRTQPELAQAFALPPAISNEGVRRYGFHGLSYEYIASVLPDFDARAAEGKTIVLHLGNGASMCAMKDRNSVATTMGFTPVDGLPMGTRCGSLDPGVIVYLMDKHGMDARAIENLIYKESGLLGISGISSDMRTLEASDAPSAQTAIDYFVYRIGRELGSLAAALGGLDSVVFTAGIGEKSALIRERVCNSAKWLGLELDPAANATHGPRISTSDSRVAAWVIPTNEELMIAQHTAATILQSGKEAQ